MLEEVLYQDGCEIQKSLSISLKREICEHLQTLQNSFKSHFYLDGIKVEPWIRNPFLSDITRIENVDLATNGHIGLKTENLLQFEFNSKGPEEFWYSLTEAYPRIVNRAMEVLIPFATTHLSESGFSTLVTIKTKSRNRLNVQHDMRVALSKTTPQFNVLIQAKQQQPSH
jgi:hypothetical protein